MVSDIHKAHLSDAIADAVDELRACIARIVRDPGKMAQVRELLDEFQDHIAEAVPMALEDAAR